MNAAARAHAIAERAHAKERRDWWLIRFSNVAEPVPVLFVPPLLQAEVLGFPGGRYSRCGVTPLLEQVE